MSLDANKSGKWRCSIPLKNFFFFLGLMTRFCFFHAHAMFLISWSAVSAEWISLNNVVLKVFATGIKVLQRWCVQCCFCRTSWHCDSFSINTICKIPVFSLLAQVAQGFTQRALTSPLDKSVTINICRVGTKTQQRDTSCFCSESLPLCARSGSSAQVTAEVSHSGEMAY